MTKTGAGVIVARFQTPYLHSSHKALIDYVVNHHNRVLICLGVSSGNPTPENPMDYITRRLMVINAYPSVEVQPISDRPSDADWSFDLDNTIRRVFPMDGVTLYGGRDSFAKHYSGYFNIKELDQDQIPDSEISASQIRDEIKNTMPVGTEEFRRGVIYANNRRFPTCYPTVDVGVWRFNDTNQRYEVLLAQKPGTDRRLMFVGGFADSEDESYEATAVRELREECGPVEVGGLGGMKYVGSFKMDDWRYKKADKVKTILFAAKWMFGTPKASDDIVNVEWYDINDHLKDCLMPVHVQLWEPFVNYVLKYGDK